jgi:TatD DNase family protein
MTSIVDTHCHLDLDAFDCDRDEVVQRSLRAGVHAFLLIGYNPLRWRTTSALCSEHEFMCRAVGIHPNDASTWDAQVEQGMITELEQSDPVAVGEIGLDFFRSVENADKQCLVFERQIDMANQYNLPIIIHQRAAEGQLLEIIAGKPPRRGVMHCFTGDRDFAGKCLDLGLYLGIGGVATFPKSDAIRLAIQSAPIDKLLLETDAPFLAPQTYRGKRNESSYLPEVVDTMARLLRTTGEAIKHQTTQNAIDLFGPQMADAVRSGLEHA